MPDASQISDDAHGGGEPLPINKQNRSDPLKPNGEQPDQPSVERGEQPTTNTVDGTPELLKVRGTKYMYSSGSRPLEGYTIKRGIGLGGFGEVYFAISDAGKEVALKRILRNLDIELRGVRQCLNLKHSNLIALWDIRTCENGECWVVMEYVPGISLRDAVNQHPHGMPIEEVDRWFSSAAAGVAYLHERGIVHRDLKPGNIFQDDHEQVVKIGDYGLSKFISSSQRDNQTESVGTFHYMAPEIGKGIYGKEVDIYAMGIILHELLTGHVPFDGESSQEIIMKHLTADPNLDLVPMAFRPVIRRSLAKDPNNRYSSVEEMMGDLNFKHVPASLHRRVQDLNSGTGRRIPPVTNYGNQTIKPVLSAAPPVVYIGDDIEFGPVQDHPFSAANEAIAQQSWSQANAGVVEDVVVVETAKTIPLKVPDEPIARAVHGGYYQLVDWWNNGKVSTPVKVLIVAAVVVALIMSRDMLVPLTLGLAFLYLVYYLVRMAAMPSQEENVVSAVVAQPLLSTSPPPQPEPRLTRKQQDLQRRAELAQRDWKTRITELSGSVVVAALACAVLGLLGLLVSGGLSEPTPETWRFYLWLILVCLLSTWGILFLNKSWEHSQGEWVLRRFAMLTLGIIVGFASFGISEAIQVSWNHRKTIEMDANFSIVQQSRFSAEGVPKLVAHVVFFASLFLMLRWWKNADPLRRSRINLFAIGICLIWAVILGQLFFFPQPWGMIVAVVIAVSLQLASPWKPAAAQLAT
ncbi:MAG TPA: serine/threonine-protein kinase [Pirellulaceae bacterium]|nr:serine/threonine-protein kinase [Pirellulaceae bacterium]HMO92333.1 serine/threonine-protein kinase [Pirellulaceae bacterium]